MQITIVGSGTVVPSLQRRQSCVVVRAAGETVVFDLGSGAVRGMLRADLDPFSVDRVFFTHFHPDHTVDVVPLLFSINYGSQENRTRPLRVAGPEPFVEFWSSLMEVWGGWMTGEHATLVSELPRECPYPIELAGGRLSWTPAEHRPESIAYRLDAEGGAFVYTGDTEYSESVVALARDADTLLIECAFPDDARVPGHLTPSDVARIASEAGVKRVVLTHIYPATDSLDLAKEVGRGFDGEIIVAEDGLALDIRDPSVGEESVRPTIRPFEARDAEAVVELSLRAWAPAFASLERVLGTAIFRRQHPDWREDQRRAVKTVLAGSEERVWIAEVDGATVGFVAIALHHPEQDMGEISMLAVDPEHQGGGTGTALTEFALDRLRDAGMRVAMVETGGDPGHAPARRTYEKSGFTLLPVARYFKNL